MEEDTETKLFVLKEIMKLPMDKKSGTIKYTDVFRLVEKISRTIPQKDVNEFLRQVKTQ